MLPHTLNDNDSDSFRCACITASSACVRSSVGLLDAVEHEVTISYSHCRRHAGLRDGDPFDGDWLSSSHSAFNVNVVTGSNDLPGWMQGDSRRIYKQIHHSKERDACAKQKWHLSKTSE